MDDNMIRLEARLNEVSKSCTKNHEDITTLRVDMLNKSSEQDIRISEATLTAATLKEHFSEALTRLEKSIDGLDKSQVDTSKEITTAATKLTIIFAVIMIVISAELAKFLG